MLRRTASLSILAAFATGSVFAQTLPPAPPEIPAPPAATRPIEGVSNFFARQEPGQWLIEDLEDMSVYAPDGKAIGEIEDVLIDESGRVVAVVIEAGGFLGIGEKRIAVPMTALSFERPAAATNDPANTRILIRLGRAELEGAPEFRRLGKR
jgi:hypothetical protein